MARVADSYASWLALVGDLLQAPPGPQPFPHAAVADLLSRSFDAVCCMRNTVDPAGNDHVLDCWPEDFLPAEPPGDRLPDKSWHPLVRWYACTGNTAPQTLGRVPSAVADRRMHAEWQSFSRPIGITHQLAIPLEARGTHAYIVSRPDQDYSDEELALAALVMPALSGALRQHRMLASVSAGHRHRGRDLGLTGREAAVLGLLGHGLTAEAIARRLGCSPRTVHKHLEHLYRKLGVHDRLLAVQRGRDAGVLPPRTDRTGAEPLAYPRSMATAPPLPATEVRSSATLTCPHRAADRGACRPCGPEPAAQALSDPAIEPSVAEEADP